MTLTSEKSRNDCVEMERAFKLLHAELLSAMEYGHWECLQAYRSGGVQQMRKHIAHTYQYFEKIERKLAQDEERKREEYLFDKGYVEYVEALEEKERAEAELEEEMEELDRYIESFSVVQTTQDNLVETREEECDDYEEGMKDKEKVFMQGIYEEEAEEVSDYDYTDSSPPVESDPAFEEPEDFEPSFTAEEWKTGRRLLEQLRFRECISKRRLATMEADWLRLALLNQKELRVFYTKEAYGRALLMELSI